MGRREKLEDAEFEKGIAAIRGNRYAEAERRFTRALLIHPGYHDALQRRAFVREERGRLKEAAADYRSSLSRFPRCRWCLEAAADLQVKLNRHRVALGLYDRAIQVDPRNANFHFYRGYIRMFLGRYRAAISDFTRVLRNFHVGMIALVGRGQAKALWGRLPSALKDFDRAIRMRSGVREHHFFRGITRFMTKDTVGAREDFLAAGLSRVKIARLIRSRDGFRTLLRSGTAGRWLTAER